MNNLKTYIQCPHCKHNIQTYTTNVGQDVLCLMCLNTSIVPESVEARGLPIRNPNFKGTPTRYCDVSQERKDKFYRKMGILPPTQEERDAWFGCKMPPV